MRRMKFRAWRIGLAILFVGAGPPMVGGAALATTFNDRPVADTLPLYSRRMDGAVGNPIVPRAAGDAVGKYLELLNGGRIRARRMDRPDRSHFGIDDLIGFMIDTGREGAFGIRFNLERRQSPDWTRFWTDIRVSPEAEQSFDYRAIAQAAYAPEIRYWLYGDRWASFDTALPRARVTVDTGAAQADTVAGPYAAVGRNRNTAATQPSAVGPKEIRGPVEAKTLREFLLSVGAQIIRQPIVYVILLVCVGMLFVSMRKQREI
jgi:hypothetical protein